MSITGNKDIDFLILDKLSDKDLLSYSMTQKNICNENFWKRRTCKKFSDICKPNDKSWKEYYFYRSKHIVLSYKVIGVKITIEVDKTEGFSQWYLNTVKDTHQEEMETLIGAGKELKDDNEIIDLGARDLLYYLCGGVTEEDIINEGIEILSGEGLYIEKSEYLKGNHHMMESFPDKLYIACKREYEIYIT